MKNIAITENHLYKKTYVGGKKTGGKYTAVYILKDRKAFALKKANLKPMIVVDCSHANSHKDYRKQRVVLEDVVSQIVDGEDIIQGVMLESYLECGNQPIQTGVKPDSRISITDSCISFEETEELVLKTYEQLGRRK